MTKIYFKPYSNRKQEAVFFEKLTDNFEEYMHIKVDYELPSSMLSNYLDIRSITDNLRKDQKLSSLKRDRLIQVLNNLPEKLKIAKKISNVSVDFTICDEKSIKHIEFHEKQHRNISDERLKPIFTPDNQRIEIPRYAQRFLKDVWRFKHLENYKIVWWDWFEKHQKFDISNCNKEFYFQDKFSFYELVGN